MAYNSPFNPVNRALCGCWFIASQNTASQNIAFQTVSRQYLPQAQFESHTTILATTSKTVLRQTFINPLEETLREVSYTFPLYDGVSVGGFKCTVADRTIVGLVKERNQARADYQEAVSKGQTAGLLEQNIDAADVFTTSIGNVPPGDKILVEITYLGELKNDAETDGARFTIPTQIAPRYGNMSLTGNKAPHASDSGGMKITVDVVLEQGSAIRGIQSPSHPIAVTMGRTSEDMDDDEFFESNLGSSTLALGSTELNKDFVVIVQAKGQDTPRALLEMHPTLPNQRVLMTTLVPKFNIPNEHPEIVFVVDRSGSMGGKMHLVIEALKVFLKSLPVGAKFNICSFGSRHTFLFDKSKTYDATSLQTAMESIQPQTFTANYGGTEMLQPVQETLKRRYKDLPLEVMLLTDGEIWNQDALFSAVNEASQKNARFFTLGIGSSASSSLVEGIARAGRGFSQWVNDGERIDKRIVRMLKGALTPHIKYKLEVKYARPESSGEEEFEIIESFEKSMKLVVKDDGATSPKKSPSMSTTKKVISLFNPKAKDEAPNPPAGRYDHLPKVSIPCVLQTPHAIPELYPHSRSTIYLLLGPDAPDATPASVTLRGASKHGDLELEIPVQDIGQGTTLHQLAAKKAMQELEEGRGWLIEALAKNGKLLKSEYEGRFDLIAEREAVRLGTTFQVGGKFCSFVAIEQSRKDSKEHEAKTEEILSPPPYYSSQGSGKPTSTAFGATSGSQAYRQSALPDSSRRFANLSSSAAPGGAPGSNRAAFGGSSRFASSSTGGVFGGAPRGDTSSRIKERASPQAMMSYSAPYTVQMKISQLQAQQQQQQQQQMAPQVQVRQRQQQERSLVSDHGHYNSAPPAPSESFSLDFSTLENADVLEDFDFEQFLETSPSNAFAFNNETDETVPPREPKANPFSSQITPVLSRGEQLAENSYLGRAAPPPPAARKSNSASSNIEFSKFSRQAPMKKKESRVENAFLSSVVKEQEADGGDDLLGVQETTTSTHSPLEAMQKLIDLQSFSGSWKMTSELPNILLSHGKLNGKVDRSVSAVLMVCKNSLKNKLGEDIVDGLSDEALATAMAVTWLESVMKDEEDVWEMVVGKAKGWLESQVDGSEVVEKMIQQLKSLW